MATDPSGSSEPSMSCVTDSAIHAVLNERQSHFFLWMDILDTVLTAWYFRSPHYYSTSADECAQIPVALTLARFIASPLFVEAVLKQIYDCPVLGHASVFPWLLSNPPFRSCLTAARNLLRLCPHLQQHSSLYSVRLIPTIMRHEFATVRTAASDSWRLLSIWHDVTANV